MDRRFWILAVAVLMGLASGDVAAQDASPAADDFVTPDPAECTVAPRSVAELRDFIAAAGGATPAPASPVPAGGEPADAETTAAVSAVTHEIYACTNANAFLRMFALYTDTWVARSLVSEDVNPEALDLFATPVAPEDADDRTSFVIREVTLLPDGRVSVLVVSRSPLAGNTETSTVYIFADQDGRWLVDDVVINPAA